MTQIDAEAVWEEAKQVAGQALQHMEQTGEGLIDALVHGVARRAGHHAGRRAGELAQGNSQHPVREVLAGAAAVAAAYAAEQGIKKAFTTVREHRAARRQSAQP